MPMMMEIGPYRFTQTDARATLRHADDLFDLLVDGLPAATAGIAAPFRAQAVTTSGDALDGALAGDFNQLYHRNGPVSRVYALVTRPGTITTGDTVVVMPE